MTTPPGATPVPPTAGAAAPSAPRTAQDVARARGSDPHALRRQLRGDLDWIVMKCLDKDRRRRYESASDLAADLTRYLRQQAVLASPPSTIYRLRKLSRRHRVAVLAAGAVLLSLVLGLCGTVWGWQVARTQRDEAMASHARAERQLRENIALASVMRMTVHLISAHGQAPSYGVKQLVADLHEAMEERLRGQPEAYVRARLALALVYEETGEHDKLNGQVDLALARARASLTQDDPALADAVQLAAFARYEAGRVVEAEQLAHEALALRARVPGTAHLALAVLAKGALVRGRFAAARKFARAGMDEARRSCGADTAEESGLLQILAGISLAEGYDSCVEPMLAQLLAQRCAQFGARHPFVGVIHVLQARAALLREDTAAAEQSVQAAEELTRSDPSVYRIQDIRCTSLRADIARARGDFAAELPLRRQACARLAATNGRASNEYARAAFQLAEALVDIGSPDEAVALCRDTLSVAPDVGGDLTLAQLYLRCALGCALHARGALAEAQAELEAALVVARAQLGATHVATATVQAALAELALAAANPDLARRMAEAAASTFALHPRPRLRLAQAQALAALASAPGDEHALRAAAGELRRHQGARKSLRQRVEHALAQARD
jgi:tetratricopeptide (TPR) repeat protein